MIDNPNIDFDETMSNLVSHCIINATYWLPSAGIDYVKKVSKQNQENA